MEAGREFAQRYRLLEQLGLGGMGEVWRARDMLLERDVALKVPSSALLDSPAAQTFRARFQREGRAAARLSHPTIARVHHADEHEGRPYLVMEYLAGDSLRDLLDRHPDGIGAHRTAALGAEIAEGLAHAHAAGVVHRDIKPANLIITASGGVKIFDFGIARLDDATRGLTGVGEALGTPAYMAPEQARGRPVTPAADVFALGMTLLHLLTGDLPDPADDPARLVSRRPELPELLVTFLFALVSHDPAVRPDAREAAEWLRAFGAQSGEGQPYGVGARVAGIPVALPEFPAGDLLAAAVPALFDVPPQVRLALRSSPLPAVVACSRALALALAVAQETGRPLPHTAVASVDALRRALLDVLSLDMPHTDDGPDGREGGQEAALADAVRILSRMPSATLTADPSAPFVPVRPVALPRCLLPAGLLSLGPVSAGHGPAAGHARLSRPAPPPVHGPVPGHGLPSRHTRHDDERHDSDLVVAADAVPSLLAQALCDARSLVDALADRRALIHARRGARGDQALRRISEARSGCDDPIGSLRITFVRAATPDLAAALPPSFRSRTVPPPAPGDAWLNVFLDAADLPLFSGDTRRPGSPLPPVTADHAADAHALFRKATLETAFLLRPRDGRFGTPTAFESERGRAALCSLLADGTLDDFTGDDLSGEVLDPAALLGVMWSATGTRWPDGTDVDTLRAYSSPVAGRDGVHQIRV